ncbi:MAG: VWA domain-containing protein [Bacilli bacterium]|nr:VWA domain-containing protein [Bacilli bacterium]
MDKKKGIIAFIKSSIKRLPFVWKKKSFLTQKEEIEILDFNESVKYEKQSKKKISFIKLASVFACVLVLFLIVSSMKTGTNIITSGAKKVLNGLGIYTEEVKSVEIESSDYDEPGSWHIDKSAEWIGPTTAQVTFDVNSVITTEEKNEDVILVLDNSGSMDGEKLQKAIDDSKELVEYLLTNSHNRVAIITFDTTSTIVSPFSNDKQSLLDELNNILSADSTNYYAALKNVETVMDGYVKEPDKDVVTLFLTDGYPNVESPNQEGVYSSLKDQYPYMTINGVQYEMGTTVIEEIKAITDYQWLADCSTLHNVLFEAVVSPIAYDEFVITDYIHDDYFRINSTEDIKVTKGTVSLIEESGVQKITWNLGTGIYMTGGQEKMTIKISLKEQYIESEGFYPTNKKESIASKLPNENKIIVNSTNIPVLKNAYEVIYDTNTPSDCTLPEIVKEKKYIYQNVSKNPQELSCEGYLFQGWKIDEEDEKDITNVNEDVFIMPSHDVTIRATWTKQSIEKSMDGKIYETTTLYKVLQEEAEEGIYAREYTGEHQDSIDPSKSTKKIYYYYGDDDEKGNEILDRNNVIFAGQCWQMIRTTDTGGVKMIYNGEAENDQCLNTRGTHAGYQYMTTTDLVSNYWYGTDYIYDSSTKTFKVSGTTEQATWSESTFPRLQGKYTCKKENVDDTCTILYLVQDFSTSTNAKVIPINANSHYSQFGTLQFNEKASSLADTGYMYNTRYDNKERTELTLDHEYLFYSFVLSKNYWYAHEVAWGSPVRRKFNLVNPYKISSTADYPSLEGEYTFSNSLKTYTNTTVYYIYKVNNSKMIYIEMSNSNKQNGEDYNDIYIYGDSYTDNGDGTYTINNPSTINRWEWYTDYSNVKVGDYLCKDSGGSCREVRYIMRETGPLAMQYYIVKSPYKFAEGFTYDENTGLYSLDGESVTFWNFATNAEKLNNAHYTCWNQNGKCNMIYYIFNLNISGDSVISRSIELTNGKSVEDALNEMIKNQDINVTSSTIKIGVDAWYKHTLLDYDDYIEDTIFCNNRSIKTQGGWNPNGGDINEIIEFKGIDESNDLRCTNITDKFSVSNPKAKLTYKVGLISSSEMNILNNQAIRKTGKYYWLISPYGSLASKFANCQTNINGAIAAGSVDKTDRGVRPAISLRPGLEFCEGDGSMANPYIIDTNN